MAEDIIAALSRFKSLFVVNRAGILKNACAYKGRGGGGTGAIKLVGREARLSAIVVEGSSEDEQRPCAGGEFN
jgi:TolB-like protein